MKGMVSKGMYESKSGSTEYSLQLLNNSKEFAITARGLRDGPS